MEVVGTMTFNEGMQIDTSTTSSSGGRGGGGGRRIAVGGGLGGLLLIVVALFLGVDPGSVMPQTQGGEYAEEGYSDPGFDLSQCKTGADANEIVQCRVVATGNSLDAVWAQQLQGYQRPNVRLFTGQVGYAWNNVLWYVKGGAALTHAKYDGLLGGVVFDSASETRWGGSVGTGIEFGFAPNWSVAIEYDHLFMGRRNVGFTFAGLGVNDRIDRIKQDVDMGTVRLNYTFGGPVVAKY